jgi:hypothetical protein
VAALASTCQSVADRQLDAASKALALAPRRSTFAVGVSRCGAHALPAAAEGNTNVNVKKTIIRTVQVLLATPSLIAGLHALTSGGKTAGSAWSQHLLESLLIIAVLEWVLRHDWSTPTVRGLTRKEWNQHWASEESHQAFERGTRVLYDD